MNIDWTNDKIELSSNLIDTISEMRDLELNINTCIY